MAFAIVFVLGTPFPLQSQEKSPSCPDNLPELSEKLLTDLPSYTNRVIQRSQLTRYPFEDTYIILASQGEFEPLPLKNLQYQPVFPNSTEQLFFTTLERHYLNQRVVTYQSYYWVFLERDNDKWYLVKVLSALASLNEDDVPLPPQDATQGAIGQGIQLWLRDCQFVPTATSD
ncbi:MAG: hypothetical protein AB4041_13050 [Microcystaceae cyanobacterium]